MKRMFLLPVLSAVLFAGPLSQGERDYALSHLHATRKMFLDSVAGLTPEQWRFKPGPDRWSVEETAEHIALSEDFITGMIRDKILASPAEPAAEAPHQATEKDKKIPDAVADRSMKFKAPEPLVPKHQFAKPEDAVSHFKESRDRTIHYIDTTQDDLRAHSGPHPVMGKLDAYQWFLLDSGHTERHVKQILEIKADPKFPK